MTYPVMLDGARFAALVVGGGAVAERKTRNLLEGGVAVTVVAPEMAEGFGDLAAHHQRLTLVVRKFEATDVDRATIVIAATNDAATNKRVADLGLARGLLVNVVDDPEFGNFTTPSVHRTGELTVAVGSGRTPAVAAAVRAAIARRFDGRYDAAIRSLRGLRDRLLGDGRREEWKRASRELIADDFCEQVEEGSVEGRVTEWR